MRFFTHIAITFSLVALFLVPLLLNGDPSVAFAQAENADQAGRVARWTIIPLLQSVGAFFITLGAFVMWVGGILLNYAIQFGIIDFANFANISGIATAWGVLRDVTNMAFIFIFLAIGISTIVGIQGYSVGRLLPKLLIVAVLVNFSLFATKAVIDVAHTFAGAILNQSGVVENQCEEVNEAGVANCALTHGVSAAFVEQFGFVNFFGASAEVALGAGQEQQGVYSSIFSGDSWGEAWAAVLFGLFSFIFMTLAGFIFLGGAVILIMRIVTLLLLMISAAPAFAAAILPGTKKYFDQWLNTLLKEAFFAPILLLLFAISLLFLNTARNTPGIAPSDDASFAEIFIGGGIDSVSLIMILIIGLGFLFMSLKIAKDLGATGAGTAMKVRNFGAKQLSTAGSSAVSFAGRNTIGRSGAAAASAVRSSKFGRTSLGKFAAQTFDGVADTSFDPRALASKDQAKWAGKPGKGFTSRAKDQVKDQTKYAKDLKLTKEEEAIKKAQNKEMDANIEKKKSEINAETDEDKKKTLQKELAALEAEKTAKNEEFDKKPQMEYADNLEKEVLSKQRSFELTDEGARVERGLDETRKNQSEVADQIKNTRAQIRQTRLDIAQATDAKEKSRLSMMENNLEKDLEDLQNEQDILNDLEKGMLEDKKNLQKSGAYEARTGKYESPSAGFFGAEATGKIDGAGAIRKEFSKDKAAKNFDKLVDALKSETGGDKKEEKDS